MASAKKNVKVVRGPDELTAIFEKSTAVVAFFHYGQVPRNQMTARAEAVFENASKSFAQEDKMVFVKIDVNESRLNRAIATRYEVDSTPTVIAIVPGVAQKRLTGAELEDAAGFVRFLREVADSSGGATRLLWLAEPVIKPYASLGDEIEVDRCELLNMDSSLGKLRTVFAPYPPSGLTGGPGPAAPDPDWIESDTDEQLLLYMAFRNVVKLFTLHITSIPPELNEFGLPIRDPTVFRPRTLRLFINTPHNLGFDEAEENTPTQQIDLQPEDWKDGTAVVPLRFVKFQKVSSLVLFVKDAEDGGDRVRLDRLRFIGEVAGKREMGKLSKAGEE